MEVKKEEQKATTTVVVDSAKPVVSVKRRFKTVFNIVIAAFLRAVALEMFLLPNKIVVGGAVGIAGLFTWLFGLSDFAGLFVLAINIPLLIVAFFKTDKNFVLKTAVCIILMAGFMELFALTNLAQSLGTAPVTDETKVLFALLGGALSGISLPLTLSVQASTGGSDIVTMILQKQRGIGNYSRVTLYIDFVTIAVVAIFSHWIVGAGDGMDVLIYSVASQFVANLVQNQIYKGYSSAYGFDIITDKPQEVAQALLENLHRGLTGLKVTGMYSHKEKTMIVCVIYKRQLNRARQIVRQVDPDAFATVYTVKEVVGNGFRNTEEDLEEKILHSEQALPKEKKKN